MTSTTTVSVERFATEAERRLIDTFELTQMLGLRSRDTIWKRVEKGTLPPPVIRRAQFSLWDREAIPTEGR